VVMKLKLGLVVWNGLTGGQVRLRRGSRGLFCQHFEGLGELGVALLLVPCFCLETFLAKLCECDLFLEMIEYGEALALLQFLNPGQEKLPLLIKIKVIKSLSKDAPNES